MAGREDLKKWVYEAVEVNGGEASVVEVAKVIWREHGAEIQSSGDLFFTWQYDMRWAAQKLRAEHKLGLAPNRKWILLGAGRA